MKKPQHVASEREARSRQSLRNLLHSATFAEAQVLARLRERVEREKLYGREQQFADVLTPEMERRVRDSIRIVNLEHAGAGRKKGTETLALKIFDEVAMLHSRGVLTDEQKLAAEKLNRDFVAAGLQGVHAFDYAQEKIDHAISTVKHDEGVVDRMDAIDRYVGAIRIIPRTCWPIVRDVVLVERRVDVVRLPGMNSKKLRRLKVITLLQTGLEQLVEHYGFDRKRRRKHARIDAEARPKREDFASTAEVDNQSEGA